MDAPGCQNVNRLGQVRHAKANSEQRSPDRQGMSPRSGQRLILSGIGEEVDSEQVRRLADLQCSATIPVCR